MKKSFLFSLVLAAQTGFSVIGASHASAMMLGPIKHAAQQNGIIEVLCKYGTPHCVNPDPGPKPPKVNTATLPDDGWVDPDCKYYGGLCDFPNEDWFGFPQMVVPPK